MRQAPLGIREVAEECRRRARLDTIDNMTAIVLLLAAKTLELQADRVIGLAHLLEHAEAKS